MAIKQTFRVRRIPEVGKVRGFGSIVVDHVIQKKSVVEIEGEIDGDASSDPELAGRRIRFRMLFSGVRVHRATEVSLGTHDDPGCFGEQLASRLLARLKLENTHTHFLVASRDWIYEVVAERFQYEGLD